jgi:hypothetical protein
MRYTSKEYNHKAVLPICNKTLPRDLFSAFIDMPEMLYHLRSNYQYWKDLEEKGVTSLGDISLKQSSSGSSPNPNLPNIPEKTF